MGTETPVLALSHLVVTLYTVKLNNPLMGTETGLLSLFAKEMSFS